MLFERTPPTWVFKEFEGMRMEIFEKEKKEEVIEARELFQASHLIDDLTERWHTSESFAKPSSAEAFREIIEGVINLLTDTRKHEDQIEKLAKIGIRLMKRIEKRTSRKTKGTEEMRWLYYAEQIKERLNFLVERLEEIRNDSKSEMWPHTKVTGQQINVGLRVSEVSRELISLSNAVHYSFQLGAKLMILPLL